jgi:hypothetical protein
MEEADLFSDALDRANKVRQDAVEAMVAGIELLVFVGSDKQISSHWRKGLIRLEKAASARVGEIEVKPEPAAGLLGDWLVDG